MSRIDNDMTITTAPLAMHPRWFSTLHASLVITIE